MGKVIPLPLILQLVQVTEGSNTRIIGNGVRMILHRMALTDLININITLAI